MKIRKYLYSLIGTLFVCCSLYGCGKTNEENKTNLINGTSMQDEYVPLVTDITEPESDLLSVEHQLYTIVKSRKSWQNVFGEDYLDSTAKYTVTDLNQNGRLELIVSTGMVGTGHFTYNKFLEIDESGSKLVKYDWGGTDENGYEGIESSDIYENMDTVYIDKVKNEYYYGDISYTHVSGAENYSSISLWKYGTKGGIKERLGDGAYLVKNDKPHERYRYFDKNGKKHKLAKENYNLDYLVKKHYDSLEKKSVSINWINYFNYNEIEQMTDVQLLHAKQKVIGTKGKELFLSDCFI